MPTTEKKSKNLITVVFVVGCWWWGTGYDCCKNLGPPNFTVKKFKTKAFRLQWNRSKTDWSIFDCFRPRSRFRLFFTKIELIEWCSRFLRYMWVCACIWLIPCKFHLQKFCSRAVRASQNLLNIDSTLTQQWAQAVIAWVFVTFWVLTCDTRFFDFRFFEAEIEFRSRLSKTELDRIHWTKGKIWSTERDESTP